MGQYFKAVNLDKREVVCPWCLDGGAKLWEWCANPYGKIFCLLLRKSSGTGGGDYGGPRPQFFDLNQGNVDLTSLVAKGVAQEGVPVEVSLSSVVGRWAEDRVCLLGDYDESGVWSELGSYKNITKQLIEEWNEFLGDADFSLRYRNCGCCESDEDLDSDRN
jgi:hypothetical protein